jgi:GNAT superfamily N-acetyltransferase
VSAAPPIRLDQTAAGVAADIRDLMREAYLVEADLLGVEDFVPLRRSVEDIASSPSRFLGVFVDGDLAAVAELDETRPEAVNLDALVVRPREFRTGLATALLRSILAAAHGRPVTVSTATDNTPALRLYAGFGFVTTRSWMTPDGIDMVTLANVPDREGPVARETDERTA